MLISGRVDRYKYGGHGNSGRKTYSNEGYTKQKDSRAIRTEELPEAIIEMIKSARQQSIGSAKESIGFLAYYVCLP